MTKRARDQLSAANVCCHCCKTRATYTLLRAKLLSLRRAYDITGFACFYNDVTQVAKAELAKVRQTVLFSLFAMQTSTYTSLAPIRT